MIEDDNARGYNREESAPAKETSVPSSFRSSSSGTHSSASDGLASDMDNMSFTAADEKGSIQVDDEKGSSSSSSRIVDDDHSNGRKRAAPRPIHNKFFDAFADPKPLQGRGLVSMGALPSIGVIIGGSGITEFIYCYI